MFEHKSEGGAWSLHGSQMGSVLLVQFSIHAIVRVSFVESIGFSSIDRFEVISIINFIQYAHIRIAVFFAKSGSIERDFIFPCIPASIFFTSLLGFNFSRSIETNFIFEMRPCILFVVSEASG